jgi:prepilin signal peptidase PulO-like enzyme (type II secretory pathway)
MNFFILFLIFLFGLTIGSFLNCLIWRLPQEEGEAKAEAKLPRGSLASALAGGRSHCPKCKKQIAWYDNIPVLSFLLLGGKCRGCKRDISWQYPLVELATGILFLIAFVINSRLGDYNHEIFNFQFSIFNLISLLRYWFIIAIMIVIFVIDLRWYLILDVVTLPSAVIVFILNLLLGFSWQNLLISGIIGGSFFFIQFIISQGGWIGGGDIRLGLLMGLALGWPNVFAAIFSAYFIGSIVGVTLILIGKRQWSSQVPLGTFLAIATVIIMLWGDKIVSWYMGLF